MKLLRYGPRGQEKPGILDSEGRIRDLSSTIGDIEGDALGPDSLKRLAAIDPKGLPLVEGSPRLGPPVARVPEVPRHWAELSGPRRRNRHADPRGADRLRQGDILHLRPRRPDPDAEGLAAHGFRGRACLRHRQSGQERV